MARRPAPAIAGTVFVSALTGYGMDTLRAEIAALLASLWVDVDVALPVRGRRAARARPRARHGRARVPRARRPASTGRVAPAARRRAGGGRRALGATGSSEPRRSVEPPSDDRVRRGSRAGARPADGVSVTWTVAEGRRGRRWREVGDSATGRSATRSCSRPTPRRPLQPPRAGVGPTASGRFHPEPTARSTATTSIRSGEPSSHIAGWSFGPDDLLIVEGSPISAAANAWRLAGEPAVVDVAVRAGVRLDPAGSCRRDVTIRSNGSTRRRWRIGAATAIEIAANGLAGPRRWRHRARWSSSMTAIVDGLWTTRSRTADRAEKLVDKSLVTGAGPSAIVGLARRGPRPKAVLQVLTSAAQATDRRFLRAFSCPASGRPSSRGPRIDPGP